MFVAVTEAGSFTAAAERLGLTKSSVSQGVAALERELGVQLLQRSTRHVAITQAGEAFRVDCLARSPKPERSSKVRERARANCRGCFASPHRSMPRHSSRR